MKASRGAAVRCGGLQVRAGGCVERVGRARADRERERERECVVYWYSFSNPRTRCIHCDNCLVTKKKCTLSYSLRSLRIYPPGC